MLVKVRLCLWLIAWFQIVPEMSAESCPADNCFTANISSTRTGQRLNGHLIRRVTPDPATDCFLYCFLDCRCVSFNTKSSTRECELNSEDTESHVSDMIDDNDYSYMELRMNRLKKCTSSGCLNYCCLQKHCQNGGTCKEMCDDPKRKYQCTCKPGYTGRNCEKAEPSSTSIHVSSSAVQTALSLSSSPLSVSTYQTTYFTPSSTPDEAMGPSSSPSLSSSPLYQTIYPTPSSTPVEAMTPSSSAAVPAPLPVDYCAGKTCHSRGTCISVPDSQSYYCQCSAGYYGRDCLYQNPWSCSDVFTQRRGASIYHVIKCKQQREPAKQKCKSIGAELARLDNQALIDVVAKLVSDNSVGDIWFGLRRYGSGSKFKWDDDGTELQVGDYSPWMSGHPQSKKNDDCVELKDGEWESDQGCDHNHGYVCELK
uniref:Toxin candidate TRINITY_DN27414_c0_g1_i1.p1 n=1 Tax=Ceriantheomorphe brasiliensis TaxID=1048506 RepID=A0A7G7WYX0_9CNID|nr:toxin candidate TRINITY_DN27414_c0_g1_i1.p1 [Ceriantheomorphe brasiliensis]